MKIHSLEREAALGSLVTKETGLSGDEAGRRLSEFGPNEIKEAKKKATASRFLAHTTHFLAILLWVAAGLSLLSEYLNPGGGMFTLGLAIAAVILINAVFTFVQEYRAEMAVEELKKLLPYSAKAFRDGALKELPAREIVPGDVLLLSPGDKIPADARIIEAAGLTVNNAPLTGESEPALRASGPFSGNYIESPNIAFAGTTVLSGSGRAVVFATGMRTEFGRIAHLTSAVEPGLSPLQKEIVKITRIVAFIATLMGVAFFLIGYAAGRTFWENSLFAIGIIVANVPEGLLPTVTLALAMGSRRMAKRNALIKTLTAVETLGSVTVICTDKTGTLTQNTMKAKEAWLNGDILPLPMNEIKKQDASRLMEIALLCNNAVFAGGKYTGDPTEAALLQTARESIGELKAERLFEIPFDSERKKMTTVNSIAGKNLALTKGSPEGLFPLCTRILMNGEPAAFDSRIRKNADDACRVLMDRGLRVLAFAYKEAEGDMTDPADIEKNMVLAGLIGLEDPPRPEVPDAIKKCAEAGIRVIMITGDATRTAIAVGKEIGLLGNSPLAIEGGEFNGLSDGELRQKLLKPDVVFTRMTPKHKMRVVSVLQEEGERVAVTGDGVNDAPALKKADIGISMGITGTDVAREASDMVLLDDNFASIVNAVEEGRAVYENIRKFMSYIFSSNIPEIVPYLAFVLFEIPLPLTIIQILAVDLGTDMLPALALGAERPTSLLMKQPPRGPKERLLNLRLLGRAYLFLGPVEAAAGLFGFFYVLKGGGWAFGDMPPPDNPLYMQATTACLTAIVITQIGNVFASRTWKESVFSIGFFSNRLIFWGIASELALQFFIVYHPWGNKIFSTSPISAGVWLMLIPFALFLFSIEEARKFAARRIFKGPQAQALLP
ncbi:MAG: cation-transporting P-type ATPase [Thermodesulfovibrionales bacterium]|nr:cation-transporting P-type ATPase [Thermodesulfovibrionales bacterium]